MIQNQDMVRFLLQQPGINVNRRPGQGDPLSRAAALPSSAIMQALLQRDIDMNHQDYEGETALFRACRCGQAENMKLLLNCANINTDIVDFFGYTLAHVACQQGHVDCLRVLIQYGLFKHEAIDKSGYNPIERACH